MAKVDVRYSKMVGETPAFAIISEGINDLVENRYYDGRGGFPVGWNDQVLYAVSEEGDIVAVLTYQKFKARNSYYVTLGYTEPSSREQGIFSQLWGELLNRARNDGVTRIDAETHVKNKPMQAALAKYNARCQGLSYALDVPPEPNHEGSNDGKPT
jgi:GNAT superfamily N-acetyltransferase